MRAFRIAYDGRDFHGFQRQPDVPTVEDALLDALVDLDVLAPPAAGAASRPVPEAYAAAGRTDAGVSALAQTVAFDAPAWLTPRAFDATLPETIRAWAHADTAEDFHATRDAERRRYRYALYAPDADAERARDALDRLAGEHDVHNLTPDEAGTDRTIETDLAVDWPFLDLTIAAGGFPRQFVRRAASLVERVATADRPLSFVDRVLGDEPLDGSEGVPPAPPEPLVLDAVEYPGLDFDGDAAAASDARRAFRRERVTARTRSRVTGWIEGGIADGIDGR